MRKELNPITYQSPLQLPQSFHRLQIVAGNLPHVVVLQSHHGLQHETHLRTSFNECQENQCAKRRTEYWASPYSGLVLELGAKLAGLALGFTDELLQSHSVVLPQGKTHIPQQKQNQFNVFLCEGVHQTLQNVEDEQGVHHLEVIQVSDDGHQIVTLFAFTWVLVDLIKLSHDSLQEVRPNLHIWWNVSVPQCWCRNSNRRNTEVSILTSNPTEWWRTLTSRTCSIRSLSGIRAGVTQAASSTSVRVSFMSFLLLLMYNSSSWPLMDAILGSLSLKRIQRDSEEIMTTIKYIYIK